MADVVHQGAEGRGEVVAHGVEGHGLVVVVFLHVFLHWNGLAYVDHQIGIGPLIVVEVDAGGHYVERVVAQLQLRLASDAEHAFAHGQQVVTVVVAALGHEAEGVAVEQHVAAAVEDVVVFGQVALSVADAIDGQNLEERQDTAY